MEKKHENPYHCSVCEDKFAKQEELDEHSRKIHEGNLFSKANVKYHGDTDRYLQNIVSIRYCSIGQIFTLYRANLLFCLSIRVKFLVIMTL